MEEQRSQGLDVEGISRRVHVDIREVKEAVSSLKCVTCEQPLARVDAGQRSVVWYCSRCDVFHETTTGGAILRTFKKAANQIINLVGDQ